MPDIYVVFDGTVFGNQDGELWSCPVFATGQPDWDNYGPVEVDPASDEFKSCRIALRALSVIDDVRVTRVAMKDDHGNLVELCALCDTPVVFVGPDHHARSIEAATGEDHYCEV